MLDFEAGADNAGGLRQYYAELRERNRQRAVRDPTASEPVIGEAGGEARGRGDRRSPEALDPRRWPPER
jgi:hypothetical protein